MRVKSRPVAVDDGDGLPWPLSEGPSVEWFAPDLYARHNGMPPRPEDPDHFAGMIQARRTYHEYLMRWAADHGMDWDAAKQHKVNRRPYW